MSLVVLLAACLLILVSLGAFIWAQWAQCNPDYKMLLNPSISMHTGMYLHQRFWIVGIFSSPAEVTGILECELHIEGIVLYFWIYFRCIKHWILIYYRGHKFPQRAKVLLPLESDAAFTSLNGHSARKSAVLVYSMMLQGHRWQRTRFVKVVTAWRLHHEVVWQAYRWLLSLQEVWAGGAMKQWPCCVLYIGQAVWHMEWKHKTRNVNYTHHWPETWAR